MAAENGNEHRRAGERELARVLRFIDGGDRRDGAETRLDRIERLVADEEHELTDVRGIVKVLSAHLDGHPLLDKQLARSVVDHVASAHTHSLAARTFGLFVGRSIIDTVIRIAELAVLAYVAFHLGIPIPH